MAWEKELFDIPGILAGEDFTSAGGLSGYNSTGQFLFVEMSGNVTVKHYDGTNTSKIPVGVSQGNSKSGAALQVRNRGVSKVMVGAANLAVGVEVGADSAGRAVVVNPTATGAQFGKFVLGVVLEAASAGDLATVLLDRTYRS